MRTQKDDIIIFILTTTFLILLLIGFIVTILFLYKRKQVKYQQNIEALKLDFEKNLLQTKLEIQEQTFKHISQEIHDNIALSLTLAKLNLNKFTLAYSLDSTMLIHSSIEQITKAINDLADISKSLDYRIIESHGFLRALEQEVERLRIGIHSVKIIETGTPLYFDTKKELIIFRIIQEAFNNILKHASANKVTVNVQYETDKLRILIEDNGIGFSAEELIHKQEEKNTAGFHNIRMRTEILQGFSEIKSNPGEGTTVSLIIPLETNT
jgi:two-component system, NarL family, sensor kinase